MSPNTNQVTGWHDLTGFNLAYALEVYDRYEADPMSVDEETRALFDAWGPPNLQAQASISARVATPIEPSPAVSNRNLRLQSLIRNIREYGHLGAAINPLSNEKVGHPLLNLATYELTEADLTSLPSNYFGDVSVSGARTALDVITHLQGVYTGSTAYEFAHVHTIAERDWLTRMVETMAYRMPQTKEARSELLARLIEVEEFERFLHRMFAGQKRFSIEGLDALVPMLDHMIESTVRAGTRHVMIGMAHRGRLNVLAHVLGKPYETIFSEFHSAPNPDMVPSEGSMGITHGWTGDVKYHLGASREVKQGDAPTATVRLANNPSHLEFVNPVVEGYARSAQENRSTAGQPFQDVRLAIPILVHGDAAFPGEGIVPETLNLSQLPGYQTGGTIHIIANNQLGFTAEPNEGRSTRYASDLAKGFEIPIIHVSADDPEACIAAVLIADAYRQRYHKDFLIDLVGYRRWGHNEMDDPTTTQPLLYNKINAHPTVRQRYAEALKRSGVVTDNEIAQLEDRVQKKLNEAYQAMRNAKERQSPPVLTETQRTIDEHSGVPVERLQSVTEALLQWRPGIAIQEKLGRILERRRTAFTEGGKVDWGHAEAMAFATILQDGTPIRITGQDSERGTFGHRHVVVHDKNTGEKDCALWHLPKVKASFAIHNSPLTEAAVIGFEYGYSVHAEHALVIWEAQFGDFANAGQVIIDQFVSSGYAKWAQSCGMVFLLPHGYEGQGPEHSSGRLERFLQLSAESNWVVANVTTTAQYFHLLRRQAASLTADARPLIVMTPKSLLRNPLAASPVVDFTNGSFQPILEVVSPKQTSSVRRLVLSAGKVGVDLAAMMGSSFDGEWLAVARVEQLYPFPTMEISRLLAQYPNLTEIVWLQEEPKNMGAWTYVQPCLADSVRGDICVRYVGRPARSSPAEGIADVHDAMQRSILTEVLTEKEPIKSGRGRVNQ